MNDLTEAEQQEYRDAHDNFGTATDGGVPETDSKGRVVPECMTDREMLKEILVLFRSLGDTLEQMGQNPMLKALMPKLGK